MNYESTRKTVLHAILEAVDKGLINGTSGNITMRTPEDPTIVCITPSGIPYEGMTPEEFEKMRTDEIPLGRLAEPEEIADLMYFLSSDKANYITGCTIDITGGVVNV